MIIRNPEEQARQKRNNKKRNTPFESTNRWLCAAVCLLHILVNYVPLCPRSEIDRCCLLAMTGTMTHFSPAESFIKCPKYQGYASLPFPACDQPLINKEGQKGVVRVTFLIRVRWLSLWSMATAQSVTPAHPHPATPAPLPLTWENCHMSHVKRLWLPWPRVCFTLD